MPRFVPIARMRQLPAALDGVGNPVQYVIPQKIAEPNPRRRWLYVENTGGDAHQLLMSSDLTPKHGGGDDTLGLSSDSFAAFQNMNPLVLSFAGFIAGIYAGVPGFTDEGFYFAELIDDVDAPTGGGARLFRAADLKGETLPAQPGPLYQPQKIYDYQPGARFLRIMATTENAFLTQHASPVSITQAFRFPGFFPLTFHWPHIPNRSLFAFDASGFGGRVGVVVGYA